MTFSDSFAFIDISTTILRQTRASQTGMYLPNEKRCPSHYWIIGIYCTKPQSLQTKPNQGCLAIYILLFLFFAFISTDAFLKEFWI